MQHNNTTLTHKKHTMPTLVLISVHTNFVFVHCTGCGKKVVARVGPTVLVVTDLEGHPRSIIFKLIESQYVTSY